MPSVSVATSCVAALVVSWTAQRITPEVIACLPVVENAFESFCHAEAEPVKSQKHAEEPASPLPILPTDVLPVSCERETQPDYAYYSFAAAAFGGGGVVWGLSLLYRLSCGRRARTRTVGIQTEPESRQSIRVQTDPVSFRPHSDLSTASTALHTPSSAGSSVSCPVSPSRDKRHKGVFGGFHSGQ